MTGIEEIIIWIGTRIWRVKIHCQTYYISLRIHIKYRQIWDSGIKTDFEVVACVLDRHINLVCLYGKMEDC
jgi:hypothetical protein